MRAAPAVFAALVVALLAGRADSAFPRPARGAKGMVASADPRATEAGLRVLERGGNAVDAAVATAFAISVAEGYAAGIGGGGFLVLYLEKTRTIAALDFRERAPLAANRDMYLDEEGRVRERKSRDGHLSVAVPGTVAGLHEVHRRHGKLPWAELLEPAIRLAREGIVLDELWAEALARRKEALAQSPAARAIFLPGGEAPKPGAVLVQADLAESLRRIANDPSDFYTGSIAAAIVEDMRKNGGLLTAEDLSAYRPKWRKPVCGAFRGHRVCSMPPPSSGGTHLLQILALVEPYDLRGLGFHHPDALHVLIEAMRIAYADRATHLGDPAFTAVPTRELTSKPYADLRRQEIHLERARSSAAVRAATPEQLAALRESTKTSHLTVVDAARNAVSLTFTVNLEFGSGVVVPGTGILLNDEMDDFAAAPGVPNAFGLVGGEANAIAPAKIPLSSMSPTIVTREGKLRLATGASGGSTIITTVLQIVLHVVEHDMDAGAAVAAPRFHHQWLPDLTRLERWGFDPLTREALLARGHILDAHPGWGNANAIVVREDGTLEGAADPRGRGLARGVDGAPRDR